MFDVDGTEVEVAVDNIDKARLVPDWAALGLAPAKPGKGKAGEGGKKTPARGARGNKTDGVRRCLQRYPPPQAGGRQADPAE